MYDFLSPLKEKHPDVRFDIILRGLEVLNSNLYNSLVDKETIESCETRAEITQNNLMGIFAKIKTSNNRILYSSVDFNLTNLSDIELAKKIAENFKPYAVK